MASEDETGVRTTAENPLGTDTDTADRGAPAAQAFGDPGDVTLVPMDALDPFRRKKVLQFRIKWLKTLEKGARRDLRALNAGSKDNVRPRSR